MSPVSGSPTDRQFGAPNAVPRGAALNNSFMGFAGDSESAEILRQALVPMFPGGVHLQVTDFRTSLATLSAMQSPEIVLVDISGEDQPLNALMALAEVVAPETSVFVIGEANKVSIYRTITKGMGVKEYLVKPLNIENVRSCFKGFKNTPLKAEMPAGVARSGTMVAVQGLRGGVGCSTIAINLAWMIGVENRRHTLLLDADLYTGTSALYLNLKQNIGLYTALEAPERMDNLLIERSAQNIGARLQVLSSNAELQKQMSYNRNSAPSLVETLNARFTSVIADTGHQLLPFARDLLYLSNLTVVVMDPSVVSVRNWERFQALPAGPTQLARPVLVLNHAGRPGGLSQSAIEHNIGREFDIVIPDLPRLMSRTAQLGTPAAEGRGPFRNAIIQLANVVDTAKAGSVRG